MQELSIFESVVEPHVERIPLVDIRCFDAADGRECEISHIVYRNVFTDFDLKLSRHLAAITGAGFPATSTTIRIRERKEDAPWHPGRTLHFASVPHALRGVAGRALKVAAEARLHLHSPESGMTLDDGPSNVRVVSRSDVQTLTKALEFCRCLGEYEFLDLSGDYDLMVVQPSRSELRPITIDLYGGTMSVPGAYRDSNESYEGALYDFRRLMTENATVRTYVAASRHALAAVKEDAVLTFRAMAETRILSFDRALAGKPLEGYRLDAAIALVARLKAGLGENLTGLSEDAQIVALDWSASIDRGTGMGKGSSTSGRFSTLEHNLKDSRKAS